MPGESQLAALLHQHQHLGRNRNTLGSLSETNRHLLEDKYEVCPNVDVGVFITYPYYDSVILFECSEHVASTYVYIPSIILITRAISQNKFD